jgi:hypothetical protein
VHARTLDLCLLTQAGESGLPRHLQAAPEPVRKAMAPYREARVGCVDCLVTWDWLAALCTPAGLPFVLGQALAMQAIPGGNTQHAKIAAHTIAVRLRGGMRPQASGEPAERRATRDLRRRRMPRLRQRAARLAHHHTTHRPDHRPELGQQLADQVHRDGVAARGPALAVPKHSTVARARRGPAARLRPD